LVSILHKRGVVMFHYIFEFYDEVLNLFHKDYKPLDGCVDIITEQYTLSPEYNIVKIACAQRSSEIQRVVISESQKVMLYLGTFEDRQYMLSAMGASKEILDFSAKMPIKFHALVKTELPEIFLMKTFSNFDLYDKKISWAEIKTAMKTKIEQIPVRLRKIHICTQEKNNDERLKNILMEIFLHPYKRQNEIITDLRINHRTINNYVKQGYLIEHKIHPGTQAGYFILYELTDKAYKYINKPRNIKLYNRGSSFEHGYWTQNIKKQIEQISQNHKCVIDQKVLGVYPDITVIINGIYFNIQIEINSSISQISTNIKKGLNAEQPGFQKLIIV